MVENDTIYHPWIPNLAPNTIKKMLSRIGVKEIEDLFTDIPQELRYNKAMNIGYNRILSEIELDRIAYEESKSFLDTNDFLVFTGGICKHYVPYVIDSIVSRSEFFTSYTPYQSEISQGLLQALFEYQSLMADLLEMDVVNASMYDGSTALAESLLMSVRLTKRKKVLIPKIINKEYLDVIQTYLAPHSIEVIRVEYDRKTAQLDFSDVRNKIDDDVAALYVENPNFLGFIEENIDEISELVHKKGALLIVGVDLISLGVLKPPGRYGADIVVGEAQPLGIGLNYGGPYLGIFAIRDDYKIVRQMPGRLIGMTTTINGEEKAFTMILQTREQHIRREKATSNICTNEALCALRAAVYLSLVGSDGLRDIGIKILENSHYALDRINELTNVEAPLFSSSFFKQFPIRFKGVNIDALNTKLYQKGILGGLPLASHFNEFKDVALYCFTEILTRNDIDFLIYVFREVLGDD